MTTPLIESVDELEELFSSFLPCGGNIFPKTRPCPWGAEAAVVNRHRQRCCPAPQDTKCLRCYAEWREGMGRQVAWCLRCGLEKPVDEWYETL